MIIIIGGEILFIGRPSILQNLWDIDFKDSKVMIILCGSAMSFIEKELLVEKNPLFINLYFEQVAIKELYY